MESMLIGLIICSIVLLAVACGLLGQLASCVCAKPDPPKGPDCLVFTDSEGHERRFRYDQIAYERTSPDYLQKEILVQGKMISFHIEPAEEP